MVGKRKRIVGKILWGPRKGHPKENGQVNNPEIFVVSSYGTSVRKTDKEAFETNNISSAELLAIDYPDCYFKKIDMHPGPIFYVSLTYIFLEISLLRNKQNLDRAGRDDVTTGKQFPSRGECLGLYPCV